VPEQAPLDVFAVIAAPAARVAAYKLASDLRREGISAVAGAAGRSLKSQMRHADSLGATYAAIIGDRELAEGSVALKHLADGTQEMVSLADVAARLNRA
jgi:histidyl-tRNA synthetase